MTPLRIDLSLPFRLEGTREDFPEAIFSFTASDTRRYLTALRKEILAGAEGMEDCLVTELSFGPGSFCHYASEDIEGLFTLVRSCFRVSPKAHITLEATPAGFDFYRLTVARHLMEATLVFEIPAMEDAALHKAGYLTDVLGIQKALDVCFQNAYRHLAFRLPARYHVERKDWERSIGMLLPYKPTAFLLPGAGTKDIGEIQSILPSGWRMGQQGAFREGSREEAFFASPSPKERIGCGLGAYTQLEGLRVRNTTSLEVYCRVSPDFTLLTSS